MEPRAPQELALRAQPVPLELQVFQELLVRLVSRAVMVLQALQVSSVSLAQLA